MREIIKLAMKEDIRGGDPTTLSTMPSKKEIRAIIAAKEGGIICGLDVAKEVFHALSKKVRFEKLAEEGAEVKKGQIVAEISGNARAILTGERTALNFMQRMSGIATLTNKFVKKCRHAKILDTRKTTPGLRELEKYAVKCGGGFNHRMGLYDMVMIKDNHIDAAGGIARAVVLARKKYPNLKIEVETRDLAEVREALEAGADRIMLDNMTTGEMAEAVKLIGKKAEIEASGNMTIDRIEEVDSTGVDFISVGAITHSARALDLSMKVVKK